MMQNYGFIINISWMEVNYCGLEFKLKKILILKTVDKWINIPFGFI